MQEIVDDNYSLVLRPIPGDIVVYRRGTGIIQHVGIVIEEGGFGNPTVIGKWGDRGLYIHNVYDVPSSFPTGPGNIQYYRSNNGSNLIMPLK